MRRWTQIRTANVSKREIRLDTEKLRDLLRDLRDGKISVDSVMGELKDLPFKDLGYAKLDNHRSLRRGAPEAIYCEGKTERQIFGIIDEMKQGGNVLATRVPENTLCKIEEKYPKVNTYPESNLAFIGEFPEEKIGKIVVITAGTSDVPVARESEITALSMGVNAETIFDVGVSGLHRVLDFRDRVVNADIAIVIAGMEGALPSVVAGLVDTPVVAVPTDVGYGANFEGITPLLTMLNSCAPGVTVVNIGDGYGAGYFAAATVKKIKGEPSGKERGQ